ncbi:MAG: DUF192 domain-containing protein [Rhodothermales bacterium]|nr:DUF192 domain-containing protein [Rhodothermales bacterium]
MRTRDFTINADIALMRYTSIIRPYRIALLVIVLLTGCEKGDSKSVPQEPEFQAEGLLAFHKPGGEQIVRIAIELAESAQEQETGLMNRRSLPALGGMLFVSDVSRERSFWMKNTPLPLDIIFVRSDSTIANIVKRTTPLSRDYIKSDGIVQNVLEVRAGFTDKYGIDTTTTISWQRREELENAKSE